MMPRALADRPRALAAVFGAALLALTAAAWTVAPDPRGIGTHEQIGLPACVMYTVTGVPCPFCGMTTAIAHMSRGRIVSAFFTHPAGSLLFMGGICGVCGVLLSKKFRAEMYRVLAGRNLARAGTLLAGLIGASWLHVIAKTMLAR